MAEGTIYHRVDSELCSQSEHGICDRRLVDFSHTPGSHVKPTIVKQWRSTKNNCPPLHITWPKPIPRPQRCVRKTFSTYFVSLSQWKITLMHLSLVCPRMGGPGNPGELDFEKRMWVGILTSTTIPWVGNLTRLPSWKVERIWEWVTSDVPSWKILRIVLSESLVSKDGWTKVMKEYCVVF